MTKTLKILCMILAVLAALIGASSFIRPFYIAYVVSPIKEKQFMKGHRLLEEGKYDEALSYCDSMLKKKTGIYHLLR